MGCGSYPSPDRHLLSLAERSHEPRRQVPNCPFRPGWGGADPGLWLEPGQGGRARRGAHTAVWSAPLGAPGVTVAITAGRLRGPAAQGHSTHRDRLAPKLSGFWLCVPEGHLLRGREFSSNLALTRWQTR